MFRSITTSLFILLGACAPVDSFFAPKLQIGEVDMAQIFRQFRESKISASILIEASSSSALQKAQVVTEAKDAIADPPVDTSLLVFIVESAIAEKAAINVESMASLFPGTGVAVISCDDVDADLSVHLQCHAALQLTRVEKRPDGCSLSAGLKLALRLTDDVFKKNIAERAVMVVIADGNARSFFQSPLQNFNQQNHALNIELQDSAVSLQHKARELARSGFEFRTVIIDNSVPLSGDAEWSEGGTILASAASADYYHVPEIFDSDLIRILTEVKDRIVREA